MDFDNEIVFRIPAPSDGIETVLVLFGIAAILVAVLTGFQNRKTVKRIWKWVTAHPWEKASATVNLLSWGALIFVGPVAAILFVMAVGEAYALLQQEGGPESSVGSLGRGAVIVALIGAPFVIWRSVVAQKTVNVTEQGHITDRINTAVQGLGAEKTVKRQRKRQTGALAYAKGDDGKPDYSQPIMEEVTEPNLEVRIGAIYALERIAQDSSRDHVQIMEILCAYIRQNAQPEDVTLPEDEATPKEWQEWASVSVESPRVDVDAALAIINRRTPDRKRQERFKGYRLSLADTTMQKLVLSSCDLKACSFDLARMQGTMFGRAKLAETSFVLTRLHGASFLLTELRGADFKFAVLHGARFKKVVMDYKTTLADASLDGASFCETDLSNVPQIADHLIDMFGDASVTLPGGHGPEHESWPAHWPKFVLGDDFDEQWEAWLGDPEGYSPPEPPKTDGPV